MVTQAIAGRRRRLLIAGSAALAVMLPTMSGATLASTPAITTATAPIIVGVIEIVSRAAPRSTCPDGMARVGGSCVDKYEASLVEIGEDGIEVPFSPYESPSGHRVRAVSRPGVVPQAHISMHEAKRACAAAGKRLCHAREWVAACKGPERTRYPYGDTRVPHACVDTNRVAPMMKLYRGVFSSRTLNDPRANQEEGTVETTGASVGCTNGYDVHDMVGNVHEWTDDGSFRGGYYLDTKLNGEGCDYRTTAHAPAYYDYSTGFRCCADAASAGSDGAHEAEGD